MLDISFIRSNVDAVKAAIKNKRFDLDLEELLTADKTRREAIVLLDAQRARKNEVSALIPKASKEDRPKLIDEGKAVRAEIERLEPVLTEANKKFEELMLRVPSLPRPEVPPLRPQSLRQPRPRPGRRVRPDRGRSARERCAPGSTY